MVAEIAAVRVRLYMNANKKWIMYEVLRKNCPFFFPQSLSFCLSLTCQGLHRHTVLKCTWAVSLKGQTERKTKEGRGWRWGGQAVKNRDNESMQQNDK